MSKRYNQFPKDFNYVATHRVVVDFEDGKQYVFETKMVLNAYDFRLYKVENGETYDETFVEVGNGIVKLLLNGEDYNLYILDIEVDGPNMHLWCEDDTCFSIEIDANCILTDEETQRKIAEYLLIDV